MSLVRSWRASLFRASGAALLVPVVLLLAVALAASLTGVGRIGTIGQLVAGPGLPPASVAEARSGSGAVDELRAVPAVPISRSTARRRSGTAAPGSAPRQTRQGSERGGERRRQRSRTRRPGSRNPSRSPSRRPASRPPAGGPAPTVGAPAEPLPGPPRATGLIRRIGAQLDRIVRPLPAVGPVAADAVNTVVQLLDPPPTGGAPAPAPNELLKPAG